MGDEGPRPGESHKITIEVSGPMTQAQFEEYKAALRECIKHFKKDPYKCRIKAITIEQAGS